jgi:hypothetical protein
MSAVQLRRKQRMRIERRALVTRHNPVFVRPHPADTLTVGNGNIAMTVDLSGLQTFPDFHELRPDPHRVASDGLPKQEQRPFAKDDYQIPLRVQSSWGWYRARGRRTYRLDETFTWYQTERGKVPYPDRMGLQRAGDTIPPDLEAGAWLHFNPRRLHLGRLALVAHSAELVPLTDPSQLRNARTELDLWTGSIRAEYELQGRRVVVHTTCDPAGDRFAVRLESGLLPDGLAIAWQFDDQPDDLASFEQSLEQAHVWRQVGGVWQCERRVEAAAYVVSIATSGHAEVDPKVGSLVCSSSGHQLEVVVALGPLDAQADPRQAAEVFGRARSWWSDFWQEGAAVSFDGSSDDRAEELERRTVLSQYLTAVNCAGSTPPQETGLTYNSWSGKFHLEMHWWHAAHFPMWGRGHLLERSIGWYHDTLDTARETARRQGYRGARWPKQTDPSGRESPSNIGAFILWQQPHLIYLLELLYAEGRPHRFLTEHYPLVEATADFMADFVVERDGLFELPPPLIPAQESYLADRAGTANPTFELTYWSWALGVANEWRRRLNLQPSERWARVGSRMRPPLLLPDKSYAAITTPPYLIREDHPSMLMARGWVPRSDQIRDESMAATLDSVWQTWDLQSTWGWDYPVMSMTAAALSDLHRAVEALLILSPKNVFLPNGHAPQRPGFLSLYLPSNGSLLAAVAHLSAALRAGQSMPHGWQLTADAMPQPLTQ